MANLGNTTRPAYVYDAETDTWLPIGVGAHSHDYTTQFIGKTLVDAKGDIVTASASDTPAILSKGADGTILVADSTTSTGLAWQPYAAQQVAGKNLIINGGMDFFQRGSLATTTAGYGLDRWYQTSSGSGANVTITQQTTGVPSGSRYCARITTGASAGYGNQFQWIETSNVATLGGKTVTVSIKLRRNAAFAGTLSVVLAKSATVDAGTINGGTWSNIAAATATNAQLPTGTTSADWYTVSFSADIPNDGTANSLQLSIQQSQVESSAYWEMAQCQLEEGPVATPFSRAGGTIQGELAACQRYYFRSTANAQYNPFGGFAYSESTSQCLTMFSLPVTMRVKPASVDYFSPRFYDGASGTAYSGGTVSLADATQNIALTRYVHTSSSFTLGRMMITNTNSATGYYGFSAEL